MAFNMLFIILKKELRALFLSPLAWVMMAVVQLVVSYQFLSQIENYLQIQGQMELQENALGISDLVISPLLAGAAMVLLLITPLLTMRLISEERKNQTLTLLMSAPMPMSAIVLGKFLSVVIFLFIMLGFISLMPLSLVWATPIDLGQLAASILGLALALCAFAAAGLYLSTLTAQPAVAAISSFGLLLLLWLLNWNGQMGSNAGTDLNLLAHISILNHLEPFLYGTFSSDDVLYFILFMSFFLLLAVKRLDKLRLPH